MSFCCEHRKAITPVGGEVPGVAATTTSGSSVRALRTTDPTKAAYSSNGRCGADTLQDDTATIAE
eukprot:CAMPEP_0179152580 /NCGR_PEP_ID=MMETSP0796-20121207/74151_1 /TAXON_ID=73915 /ORGANISM="Pyrodinium bahamense, Strain pbaha01" /LENGTH=64 /DNA_ID=CAMNT_0020853791 /DNA_START=45 /DNA_END=236 /DNA_ORIENTATION=-